MCQLYHGKNKLIQVNFKWDDQDRWLDFYSVSSLKQQSEDSHVTPLEHIILIPRLPVFSFSLMLHA